MLNDERIYELRQSIAIAEFQRDLFGPGADFEDEADNPASYQERLSGLRAEMREVAPHRPEGREDK